MVRAYDTPLMQKALKAAWAYQILTFPNPAVGAVVSDDTGTILGIGAHVRAGSPHAEVIALKEAYVALTHDYTIDAFEDSQEIHDYLTLHHRSLFHPLTLHVTLEPCHHYGKTPPCSHLIQTLGIKRVVIGSYDESTQAKGGGAYLQTCGVEVEYGCEKEACDRLLEPFTCQLHRRPFLFFKVALSANGVATGGTISSLESRTRVHALRDRCDLLVIGGNTVRVDRPILDARLVQGKAPDILIYSHHKTWDKSIPLFSVANRHVSISKELALDAYRMVMIEGAQGMLDAVQQSVQWYLIFRSPHTKEGKALVLPQGLELCYCETIGEDTLSWYYKRT